MRLLAFVLVQLFLVSPAAADDAKSPEVAVGLSVGVTAAGAVTFLAADDDALELVGLGALYFGPSTGHWYAGRIGGIGLATRGAAGLAAMYGLGLVLASECDDIDGDCAGAHGHGDAGAALMIGGAALWVGSSIYDVVAAKRAIDDWNVRHAITVVPTALGPQRAPGLVLSGEF